MDWGKLAAWLYEGSPVDYVKAAKYRVGTIYVDPRSGNAAQILLDAQKHGLQTGIYHDPHWYPNLPDPGQYAQSVSGEIARLIPGRGNPVMVDIELVPVDWQAAFVTAYRALRPQRETSVTAAPFQAPVLALQAFAAAAFHVYAQTYYGDMSAADPGAIVLELARAGFPADRIHPFYAGERLPTDARDGAVFTLERLP